MNYNPLKRIELEISPSDMAAIFDYNNSKFTEEGKTRDGFSWWV